MQHLGDAVHRNVYLHRLTHGLLLAKGM
jgi:hypothetical protein